MKKGKLMVIAALTAILIGAGAWSPVAGQADVSDTVVAQGDMKKILFPPTILPPV